MQIDQQTRTDSKMGIVDQAHSCLKSGHYSRALNLLRPAMTESPDDPELLQLEKLAQEGVQRNAEAQRLITESQELFSQQKPSAAIQLLRQAYELDKKNSLARSILANALVEHAQALVETDWLESEKLTNQALAVNPAHPTAKSILNLIVEKKEKSSAEDWVSHAGKLQSSGDLFGALAWVAEGLAVHPNEPRLLQIQDGIQRDQAARRRQTRRLDMDDLRRMELEIKSATDTAAKQALAERIQAVVARYWTDGEILAIANALLLRLGLLGATASSHKGAPIIFHVPRPNAPKVPSPETCQALQPQVPQRHDPQHQELQNQVPDARPPQAPIPNREDSAANPRTDRVALKAPPDKAADDKAPSVASEPEKVPAATLSPQPSQVSGAPVSESLPAATKIKSASPRTQPNRSSSSATLVLVSSAAILLIAATFFLTRKHYVASVVKTPTAAPAATPAPKAPEPVATVAPELASAQTNSERPTPDLTPSPESTANLQVEDQLPEAAPAPVTGEASHKLGSLLVIAGQDNAKVFLNGQLQRRLTRSGQLRLPNLEPNDYTVRVSKNGFQDPPQRKISILRDQQATLTFNLQPQPHLAAISIQGGVPGTAVLVDQAQIGTIQSDGTLSVSSINPGDHTLELRKDRFQPRVFKEQFVAGKAVSLAAADVWLQSAAGVLKITFAPADAKVAIVKGDFLAMVNSDVPLNLAPGTYTLTARAADGFRSSSTLEVIAGQSRTLNLSLTPNGMAKWDDPAAWKRDKDSFVHKGGDFVLYGVVPAAGTFAFSAVPAKGHLLQWVLNYTDSKNYLLFQMDENNFYRTVIRNGEKREQIIVPDKSDRKSFHTLHVRVSPTEIVHQVKHGDSWTVLDRWTQPGANLSTGKFGFYIPGNDEVALSSFAHYADLSIR